MTSKERSGFPNIIWLCQNCGTKIDRDPSRYPAELLNGWKVKAEELAQLEQGRKLPDESDICTTVAMALGNKPSTFYPKGIGNVHAAVAKHLEGLDGRFHVTTSYVNGTTHIGIQAKEDVAISINVGRKSQDAWQQGLRGVVDFGRSVALPLEEVTFEGSEIFRKISESFENGVVKVAPHTRPAQFKIWSENFNPQIFEVIPGALTLGRQQCTFLGSLYGGLIEVELVFSVAHEAAISSRFTITTNVQKWTNVDALNPPFLESFIKLVESFMDAGVKFKFSFEVEGIQVTHGKLHEPKSLESFRDAYTYASYVRRAMAVLRYLRHTALIDATATFSAEEHRAVANACDIVEGRERYERSQVLGMPEMTIHCEDDGVSLMEMVDSIDYRSLQIINPPKQIRIYNRHYELPQSSTYYAPVKLRVISKEKIANGTNFRVGIEMDDDFTCQTVFELPTDGPQQSGKNVLLKPL